MGENMKKGDKKESIFSVYRYNNNHQNPNPCERENKTKNMMSLHIPGEHCQFSINSYQQPSSFTFDAAADTIVVTLGEQLMVILFVLSCFVTSLRMLFTFHLITIKPVWFW